MTRLAAGDTAPAFTLPDQDGKKVSLASLRRAAGKSGSVVVYFYPADDTPGCTKEACQFNENLDAFSEIGTVIVGISPDGAEKHQHFRAKYGLDLTLLSDPEHVAMIAYGAYGTKTLYGKPDSRRDPIHLPHRRGRQDPPRLVLGERPTATPRRFSSKPQPDHRKLSH